MYEIPMEAIRHRHNERWKREGNWFGESETRFFGSRYARTGYRVGDHAYFLSSERFDSRTPRLYTIRYMLWETGEVLTVGEFQQHTTWKRAHQSMMRLIHREENSVPAVDQADDRMQRRSR